MYNSTIINKKKKLSCGCFDYNFSKNRCKMHATQQSTAKRMSEHEDKEEDESVQNLIQDLDVIFSRYVRLKYANDKGIVQCFTCPKQLPISEIQNGHYIHRSDLATRFMEQNCRPQCPQCNQRHNDDPTIFRDCLENETLGITLWLREQAREVVKPARSELKMLLLEYRHKVKILEKTINKP